MFRLRLRLRRAKVEMSYFNETDIDDIRFTIFDGQCRPSS